MTDENKILESFKHLSNEITDSIADVCKKRLTTPIYGTFLISWLIFHWDFIFTMFGVSESKIWDSTHLLKNDYLVKTFFNYLNFWFWFKQLIPFLITYLALWHFPKWVAIPAFEEDEKNKTEKRRIKIRELKKIEREETQLEKENIKKIKIISKKTKEQEELEKLDPSIFWKEDYKNFALSPYFQEFDYLIESIYKQNGWLSWQNNQGYRKELSKEFLAFIHSNELVEFSDKNNNSIVLTEKGKYFVKQFSSEEKPLP